MRAQRKIDEADVMPPTADRSAIDGWNRVCDALTELHAYVMILHGDLERTEARLAELGPAGPPAGELPVLRRRRTEIAAQLELLSRVIIALRATADPSGKSL
jgi:hypothetical protein